MRRVIMILVPNCVIIFWLLCWYFMVFPHDCLLYNRRWLNPPHLLVEIHLFAGWNSLCLFVCLLECLLAELHTIVDYSIHVERCFGKLLISLGELSDFGGFHGCFPRSFWSLSCFPPIESSKPYRQGQWGWGAQELKRLQYTTPMLKWYPFHVSH